MSVLLHALQVVDLLSHGEDEWMYQLKSTEKTSQSDEVLAKLIQELRTGITDRKQFEDMLTNLESESDPDILAVSSPLSLR